MGHARVGEDAGPAVFCVVVQLVGLGDPFDVEVLRGSSTGAGGGQRPLPGSFGPPLGDGDLDLVGAGELDRTKAGRHRDQSGFESRFGDDLAEAFQEAAVVVPHALEPEHPSGAVGRDGRVDVRRVVREGALRAVSAGTRTILGLVTGPWISRAGLRASPRPRSSVG